MLEKIFGSRGTQYSKVDEKPEETEVTLSDFLEVAIPAGKAATQETDYQLAVRRARRALGRRLTNAALRR